MTERAEQFCMQYMMRREELWRTLDVFRDSHEEDLRVNADMFDVTRLTITGNLHPNATMRALEDELEKKDLPLLHMLAALITVGEDLVHDLCEFETFDDFLDALAAEYEASERRYTETGLLASDLTAPKAQHQMKRLYASLSRLRELLSQ